MREEFWKIAVHEDGELEELLGGEILAREKLHHWPLSYVEKVTMKSGETIVYKAQHASASVENDFYARVRAPFLLEPVFLAEGDSWAALALPYVEIPPQRPLTEDFLREKVGEWGQMLQGLADVPIYFDLASPEKLAMLLEDACQALPPEAGEDAARLRRWAESGARVCYESQPVGLLHGDLTGGNVVLEGAAIRWVLDWQRPMRGPLALETAMALLNAGDEGEGPFGRLALACRVLWYAYAYRHLLPLPAVLHTAQEFLQRFCAAKD